VETYAAAEIRLSLRQKYLDPVCQRRITSFFYPKLQKLGFAEIGYNKAVDITRVPSERYL